MTAVDPRRFAVVGAGVIAERHMSILRELVPGSRFTVWRRRAISCGDDTDVVHTLPDAIARRPRAAIIASPATHHIAAALAFAKAGIDIFVEKPLSASLEGVEELLDVCEAAGVVLQVGYCLRFSAGFAALISLLGEGVVGRPLHVFATVSQYLPDWRPDLDYRQSVSAHAALGGGAALELSHEFDYVRVLLGSPTAVTARLMCSGTLDVDVEDCLDAIIEFAGGAQANIHLDMLSRPAERRCRIVGRAGTAEWDLRTDQVRVFCAASGQWRAVETDPLAGNMYQAQMRHFLGCLDSRGVPEVSGRDGADSLALALAARQAALAGQSVAL
jgi:predicted dehydrogenase